MVHKKIKYKKKNTAQNEEVSRYLDRSSARFLRFPWKRNKDLAIFISGDTEMLDERHRRSCGPGVTRRLQQLGDIEEPEDQRGTNRRYKEVVGARGTPIGRCRGPPQSGRSRGRDCRHNTRRCSWSVAGLTYSLARLRGPRFVVAAPAAAGRVSSPRLSRPLLSLSVLLETPLWF